MPSRCGGFFLLILHFQILILHFQISSLQLVSHAASLLFAGTKEDAAFQLTLILTIAMH